MTTSGAVVEKKLGRTAAAGSRKLFSQIEIFVQFLRAVFDDFQARRDPHRNVHRPLQRVIDTS